MEFFIISYVKKISQRKERAFMLMLIGMLSVLWRFWWTSIKTHREYNNFKDRENRTRASSYKLKRIRSERGLPCKADR